MTPIRLSPADDMVVIHRLLTESFAFMEGRIDPPSSLHRMTPETLAQEAADNELWAIEPAAPLACMILRARPDHLYLGKLATAAHLRRRGLARSMIAHAETRARALSLPELRLEVRIELDENHAFFRRLGFTEIARTAHPGYLRPTSLTFARPLDP